MSYNEIYQAPEPHFESRVCQGDLLKPEAVKLKLEVPPWGWMVSNAICDLGQDSKINYFRFVPVRPLEVWLKTLKANSRAELLRKAVTYPPMGKMFFLPPIKELGDGGPAFADLGFVISVAMWAEFSKASEDLTKIRLASLKPPWREKFGEMLSQTFFRVGVADQPPECRAWQDGLVAKAEK